MLLVVAVDFEKKMRGLEHGVSVSSQSIESNVVGEKIKRQMTMAMSGSIQKMHSINIILLSEDEEGGVNSQRDMRVFHSFLN